MGDADVTLAQLLKELTQREHGPSGYKLGRKGLHNAWGISLAGVSKRLAGAVPPDKPKFLEGLRKVVDAAELERISEAYDRAKSAKPKKRWRSTDRPNVLNGNGDSIPNLDDIPRSLAAFTALIDEYRVSDRNPIPFGGRVQDLDRLDNWLANDEKPSHALITALSGCGKTALVIDWIKSIEGRNPTLERPWHVVFMPISLRIQTNREERFLGGIAERLSDIARASLKASERADLKEAIGNRFATLAVTDKRILVVVDGLDEAPHGTFEASIFPNPTPNLRVLLAARLQAQDVDGKGWKTRLWGDHAPKVELIPLMPLGKKDTAAIIARIPSEQSPLLRDTSLPEQLMKLTDGEAVLLHHYLKDIAFPENVGSAITTMEELAAHDPGFKGYFDRWEDRQEQLWRDEGLDTWEIKKEINRALSVLTFAHGPLESEDFRLLMEAIYHWNEPTEYDLLKLIRRYLWGDGQRGSGYVLSHPKLAEYFQKMGRFRGSADHMRKAFLDWGQTLLRKANGPTGTRVPPYAVQYLASHFAEANVSLQEWMELVEDGWRRAWLEYDGGTRGFARDVQTTWSMVRKKADLAFRVGAEWRCTLVLSSIKSIGKEIPVELLCAALQSGKMSFNEIVHLIDIGHYDSASSAIKSFVELSHIPTLTSDQKQILHSKSVHILLNRLEERLIPSCLELLVDKISQKQIEDVLLRVETMDDMGACASALTALAQRLPMERQASMLERAASAAKKTDNQWLIASVFRGLFIASRHLQDAPQFDALAAARAIEHEPARTYALTALVKHLSANDKCEVLDEALLAAKKITDKEDQASAYLSLVKHLKYLSPESQKGLLKDALSASNAIDHRQMRAYELGCLSAYLPPEQQCAVLDEALSVTAEIDNDLSCAEALGALGKYLLPDHFPKALQIVRTIEDERQRGRALTSLAERLSSDQLSEALSIALAISYKSARAYTLGGLVQYLSQEQRTNTLDQALSAAVTLDYVGSRAHALGIIAEHLSPDQLDDALLAVRAVGDESWRADALARLSGQVSHERRDGVIEEALVAARTIDFGYTRSHALELLIPLISPERRGSVLDEALSAGMDSYDNQFAHALHSLAKHLLPHQLDQALLAACTIESEGSRASVLRGLAEHLSADQLEKALEAAIAIGDEQLRSSALGSLAKSLRPHQFETALTAVRSIKELGARASALVTFVRHCPRESQYGLVSEALSAAERSQQKRTYAFIICDLIQYCSLSEQGKLIDEALYAIRDIGEEYSRFDVILRLIQYVSPKRRSELLGDAREIASATADEQLHGYALARLVQHLPLEQQSQVVDEARAIASAIGDHRSRCEALTRILEHLPPGQRARVLDDALSTARSISFEVWRAEALVRLVQYLPPDQKKIVLDETFSLARASWELSKYARMIALYFDDLSPSAYHEELEYITDRAARCSRGEALATMANIADALKAWGGTTGIDEIARAIIDTKNWYQ